MASQRRRQRAASLERVLLPSVAILVAALLATLLVRGTASTAAGWLAAAAGVIAVALVAATRSGTQVSEEAGATMQRLGDWLLVPLPALAVLYLAFNDGGYFPG